MTERDLLGCYPFVFSLVVSGRSRYLQHYWLRLD